MEYRVVDPVLGERAPARGRVPVSPVIRGVAAAGLLLSADVHLVLYAGGYGQIAVIGPLFLVNVAAGIVLGVALLVWRHWLVLLGTAGFGTVTLAAYAASRTVGLFGVREMMWDSQAVLAAVAEAVAVVGAVLIAVVEKPWRYRRRG